MVWQPVLEKENSEFKPAQEIELVLHPACAEGLVNTYVIIGPMITLAKKMSVTKHH